MNRREFQQFVGFLSLSSVSVFISLGQRILSFPGFFFIFICQFRIQNLVYDYARKLFVLELKDIFILSVVLGKRNILLFAFFKSFCISVKDCAKR